MTNQKRTIIGACDYSIETLKQLKKDLQTLDAKNTELNWAIGGIVATLSANLLKICNDVFNNAVAEGNPNAKHDLTEISDIFTKFIENMINHE